MASAPRARGLKDIATQEARVGLDRILQIPVPCHLFRLPNELLAELAVWLSHPVDLLSLAKTSNHFYRRLSGPNAALLWKRTRASFEPTPVPNPPAGLSEIAWAMWLFGPHACAECGRKTFALPFSFRLRLHLCKTCAKHDKLMKTSLFSSSSALCKETTKITQKSNGIPKETIELLVKQFVDLVPQLESTTYNVIRAQTVWAFCFYDFDMPYSNKAWQLAIAPVVQAAAPNEALKETVEALLANRDHSLRTAQDAEELLKWTLELQKVTDANEAGLIESAQTWAKKERLGYEDLKGSQEFRELWAVAKYGRLSDINALLSSRRIVLLSQTHSIHASRTNAAQVLTLQQRQQEISQYYTRQIGTQRYHPTLRVFRSLPAVKSLVERISDSIKADLKTLSMQRLISAELDAWLDRTAREVRLLLGYDVALDKVGMKARAPEKWCTSLFVCGKCHDVEGPYKRARVLDFRGLCAHQCKEKHKSRNHKTRWAVANFEVETKAQDIVRIMVASEGLEVEDASNTFLFDTSCQNERVWKCGNCELDRMSRQDLVRHCLRHDEQKISRVEEGEHYTAPNRRLSFAQLTSKRHSAEARKKQFECTHCPAPLDDGKRPRPVMDLHGMRSHLKAKHGVLDVRNEDFSFVQT